MLMTEEEAKGKFCPYMYGQSEHEGIPLDFFCLAGKCMAWRQVEVRDKFGDWVYRGYCGLAGIPKEAN